MRGMLVVVLAPVIIYAAGAASNQITWTEFSARIGPKHTIRLVLPDGTKIDGRPVRTSQDAVQVRITRTSNRQAHPKGIADIPRGSMSLVGVRSPRWLGRTLGTVVPLAAGVAILAAGVVARQGLDVYELAVAGGATMAIGIPVGFFVGRAIDRRFEWYVIRPEP